MNARNQTLIELLGIDREKTMALDAKISDLLRKEIEPSPDAVAALLVVGARFAAHMDMPFVLAVSLLEWLYNERAKQKLLDAALPPSDPSDPSMH